MVDIISKRINRDLPSGFLGINIGPNKDTKIKEDDYYSCFTKLSEYAGYITINISSPNTEGLRNFHKKSELEKLLFGINKIKQNNNINKPMLLKISPDLKNEEISECIELILKYKISGVIISNTADENRDELIDIKKRENGGLSGKPLRSLSTNLIKKFYKETKGKIQIIGVGGIDSGHSAFEKISAGADVVQLYTGMVYKGPGIVKEIAESLFQF